MKKLCFVLFLVIPFVSSPIWGANESVSSKELQELLAFLELDLDKEPEIKDTTKQLPDISKQEEVLPQILDLFKEYCLNAPWVTNECMELRAGEFDIVWKEIVKLLTTSENRWYYFCDKLEDFESEDHWKQCVWQCRVYDEWMHRLFIDLVTGELIIKNKGAKGSLDTVSIFEYLSMMNETENKNESVNTQFYAFYVDCLTHLFEEYVTCVKEYADDKTLSQQYWSLAMACLDKFDKIMNKLRSTSKYNTYQLTVKRLREIILLVEEEVLD